MSMLMIIQTQVELIRGEISAKRCRRHFELQLIA